MKQEQNCAVWRWNYPGFPCPGGESIVIPVGPPLRSLGTGTCRIWKPMLLQSFQHDVMAAALLREWKWAFPQRSWGKAAPRMTWRVLLIFWLTLQNLPASKPRAPCPAARRTIPQTVQKTFAFLLSHTWYKQGAKPKDRLHQLPALTTGKLTSQQDDLSISHSKAPPGWDRTSDRGSLS